METFSIWQIGFLLFLILLIAFFLRSLRMGKDFQRRQEMRHEHFLEKRRIEVSTELSQSNGPPFSKPEEAEKTPPPPALEPEKVVAPKNRSTSLKRSSAKKP